jgi:hypothetical protein
MVTSLPSLSKTARLRDHLENGLHNRISVPREKHPARLTSTENLQEFSSTSGNPLCTFRQIPLRRNILGLGSPFVVKSATSGRVEPASLYRPHLDRRGVDLPVESLTSHLNTGLVVTPVCVGAQYVPTKVSRIQRRLGRANGAPLPAGNHRTVACQLPSPR